MSDRIVESLLKGHKGNFGTLFENSKLLYIMHIACNLKLIAVSNGTTIEISVRVQMKYFHQVWKLNLFSFEVKHQTKYLVRNSVCADVTMGVPILNLSQALNARTMSIAFGSRSADPLFSPFGGGFSNQPRVYFTIEKHFRKISQKPLDQLWLPGGRVHGKSLRTCLIQFDQYWMKWRERRKIFR